MTITNYDTIVKDILDRIVAIEKTIVLPAAYYDNGQTLMAVPRFWEPNQQFPFMYNRWSGMQGDNTSIGGAPFYEDVLTFELRLITGSLNTGYIGDREDTLNAMIYSVINRFRQVPALNDPATGAPLRYLAPGRWATLITNAPNGSVGFTMGNGGELLLGCNFNLSARIRVQIGRTLGTPITIDNGYVLLENGTHMLLADYERMIKAG